MNIKSEINQNIKDLALFLLIDQLSNPKDLSISAYSVSDFLNNYTNNNIATYPNPLYLKLKQQFQLNHQQHLKKSIKNSKYTQNQKILIKHIASLPKLRYQQSQKLLQPQILKSKNFSQFDQTPQKLSFQNYQEVQNFSTIIKDRQQTQFSQKVVNLQGWTGKTPKSKLQVQFPSKEEKRKLDNSAQEEQLDIQNNMSVISGKPFKQFEIRYESAMKSKGKNDKQPMANKRENNQSEIIFWSQSEKKAKLQKNSIQNYFQSAKNQILQNCSLNCCEALLANPYSTQIQTNINTISLKKDPIPHIYQIKKPN